MTLDRRRLLRTVVPFPLIGGLLAVPGNGNLPPFGCTPSATPMAEVWG